MRAYGVETGVKIVAFFIRMILKCLRCIGWEWVDWRIRLAGHVARMGRGEPCTGVWCGDASESRALIVG
jgi:hypothetical protein